jgi:hypothetical protein
MSRFVIQLNEAKTRRSILWGWFCIGVGSVFFLYLLLFGPSPQSFIRIAECVIAFNIVATGISLVRNWNKADFIEIDEKIISVTLYKTSKSAKSVSWRDIRLIKKEGDGSITLFQESSFSNNFGLAKFSEEDQERILALLQEKANAWQIPLINFSPLVSALV